MYNDHAVCLYYFNFKANLIMITAYPFFEILPLEEGVEADCAAASTKLGKD